MSEQRKRFVNIIEYTSCKTSADIPDGHYGIVNIGSVNNICSYDKNGFIGKLNNTHSVRRNRCRRSINNHKVCLFSYSINTFFNSVYTISNEYDRMGCRMQGPVIKHKVGGDIITDGISFGAVQVPSHGNPIVMMADHQTTGGYTKIGNVISVDLPILAQCMPGHKIHFQWISIEAAQYWYCREKKEFKELKEKFQAE